MSFSSQGVACFLINEFKNWFLIVYIKMPRRYKCQQLDKSENEMSVKFSKGDDRYIFLSISSTQKNYTVSLT